MYTYGYLFYIPINLVLLTILGMTGILKKRQKEYYFFVLVTCIYLNILIEKAFFPIFIDGSVHYKSCWDYVNINILSIMRYTPYQIIGNIVLTFPVGILLAFVMNYTWKQRIIVSTIFSVMIEVIQLCLIILLRLIDVDFDLIDIVLNVGGTMLGHLLFYAFCKIYVGLEMTENAKNNVNYFRRVCENCAGKKKSLDGLTR